MKKVILFLIVVFGLFVGSPNIRAAGFDAPGAFDTGIGSLGDFFNFNITSGASGDMLYFDGTSFVNTSALMFDGISLTVTGPILGDGELELGGTSHIAFNPSASNFVIFKENDTEGFSLEVDISEAELTFLTSDNSGNQIIISNDANKRKDHDLALRDDPTLAIFSDTDPNSDNTQRGLLYHDKTDFNIESGKGNINLITTSGSSIVTGVSHLLKKFRTTVTLDTGDAETDVGLTAGAVIMSAAIRVSTQITALDSADHHIQLGINGDSDKYIDVAQGGAQTTIDVNVKDKYTFNTTVGQESAALVLTITGGSDSIPAAGAVEVEIIYLASANLPDV